MVLKWSQGCWNGAVPIEKDGKTLTSLLKGQEGQVVKSLSLTTENHIPQKQPVFRMVTSLFCIQRESNCMKKERAFRELNFLSCLGSKTQSTSWPSQEEQLKLSLSREGKSNSKGVLRAFSCEIWQSAEAVSASVYLFNEETHLPDNNCINCSYSHFPSGHVVGDSLRGQLPEDKWFPWNPPAHRRKKALLYLLSCGLFCDLAS